MTPSARGRAEREPVTIVAQAPTLRIEPVTVQLVVEQDVTTVRHEEVKITSYNSLAWQTDSTPDITATGQRTRYGIVAVSRDLLSEYPYGTKLLIVQAGGHGCNAWDVLDTVFEVQDTMHIRKKRQVDIWLPELEQSRQWGACQGKVLFLQ